VVLYDVPINHEKRKEDVLQLTFSSIILACGGELESFPGTITTSRYPLPYPSNRECHWKILAPQGMYIHVEFHGVYSLEYLCTYVQCQCEDILEIKDGGKPLPYEPYQG
jgi:hypothetical protein